MSHSLSKVGFALTGLFLLWQVVFVNLTQYGQAVENKNGLIFKSSLAEIIEILELAKTDYTGAAMLAKAYSWRNPLDGRGVMLIALLQEEHGDLALAKKLVSWIERLYPRQSLVQLQLGGFWARQGDLRRALAAWGTALEMQPSLREVTFPDLLRMVDRPQYYRELRQTFGNSARWGEVFFTYAVRNASHIDTLKILYQARLQGQFQPTPEMRRAFLDRLLREGLFTDAYFVWLNSLNNTQIKQMGHLFDGGFEVDATEEGFAWQFSKSESLLVAPQKAFGANGRALHVTFKGVKRVPSVLAEEILMLDAGRYQLSGRIKLDSLSGVTGVRWELACLDKAPKVIAKTEDFIDKTSWKNFTTTIEVPSDCEAQTLRLILDPADAARPHVTGSMWFDDLVIEQTSLAGAGT